MRENTDQKNSEYRYFSRNVQKIGRWLGINSFA